MRTLSGFVIGLFFQVVGFGQQPTLAWAKSMGNSSYNYGLSVTTDYAGNVYTTGYFEGTTDFNPGPGVYNITSISGNDIFVSKLDAAGNFVWAKSMGGIDYEQGNSIAVDAVGNVYVTGRFYKTVDFDPGPGIYNLTSSSQRTDIFILKLDTFGNFVWAKSMGGYEFDDANSVVLDVAGNIYLTGGFGGTVDFDPGNAVYNLTSNGGSDVFVLKLSNSGNFVWAKNMGGASTVGGDGGSSLAVDATGNVYITGSYYGMADFDPGPGNYTLTSHGNSNDAFVCKLNPSGDFVWAKSMGGISDEYSYSIGLDALGNIFTIGSFQSTADFDPGTGTFNLASKGQQDIFVLKLNNQGNFLWAKDIGGIGGEEGLALALDSKGSVYITGDFQNTVDFDPGVSVFNIQPKGGYDIFIAKYDSLGNFVFASSVGGDSSTVVISRSIALDAIGNIHTTGFYYPVADFDPGNGVYNLTTTAYGTIFVLKLNQAQVSSNILSLTAKQYNQQILLQWQTNFRSNLIQFVVERRNSLSTFSSIGNVAVIRSGIYSFFDTKPLKDINFYRLKLLAKDGSFTYSKIVEVKMAIATKPIIHLFPNPAKDNLQIQIESYKQTALQLQIISQDGKVLLSHNTTATAGSILRSINISALPRGNYYLKATMADKDEQVVKFEKL